MDIDIDSPKILVVDDDNAVGGLMVNIVRFSGYEALEARSIKEFTDIINEQRIDICFMDFRLKDGMVDENVVKMLKKKNESLVLILVTGMDYDETIEVANKIGTDFYIIKPFSVVEFQSKLNEALEEWKTRVYKKKVKTLINKNLMYERKNKFRDFKNYGKTYDYIIELIGNNIAINNFETHEHRCRVAEISVLIGNTMGLEKRLIDALRWGAFLHDIGMVIVPEYIFKKPSELNKNEYSIIKKHPAFGFKLIDDFELLKLSSEVVLNHHEKYDGNGYPEGKKGKGIPLLARIFSVSDAYDAMTGKRYYRLSIGHDEALKEIKINSGKQFDPEVVEAFLSIPYDKINRKLSNKEEVGYNGFAA